MTVEPAITEKEFQAFVQERLAAQSLAPLYSANVSKRS